MARSKAYNEFESFLNECNIYVWEWYSPERFVRFGIPSLDGLWANEHEKIFKLATVLERVHPDDVDKIFVRRSSPIYKSDSMFEIDLRLNLNGQYEWYGFRGKTLKRDKNGRPTYLRGVAINIDKRIKVQQKLMTRKDRHLKEEMRKTSYFSSVMQEVLAFIRTLASNADSIIMNDDKELKEERLLKLNDIKEQGARIANLVLRIKSMIGEKEPSVENHIRCISLWEHLAELQQVFSINLAGNLKLYFSNMYDSNMIKIDVNLFDLLLENVVKAQMHNARHGSLVMNYSMKSKESLLITVTCTENERTIEDFEQNITEAGLGLSVCRLVAQRLYGEIHVVADGQGRIQYQITLPLDATNLCDDDADVSDCIKLDVLDELTTDEDYIGEIYGMGNEMTARPHVLIGVQTDTDIFQNQHLFEVATVRTTDSLMSHFAEHEPDIVFADSNLKGELSTFELITEIRKISADTPIIITADYAARPLHKKVRQLGAQYLLSNPLSLRKVNVMIKKYLK